MKKTIAGILLSASLVASFVLGGIAMHVYLKSKLQSETGYASSPTKPATESPNSPGKTLFIRPTVVAFQVEKYRYSCPTNYRLTTERGGEVEDEIPWHSVVFIEVSSVQNEPNPNLVCIQIQSQLLP